MKIKICGIRRMEDVRALNRLMPDYAGFVFADSRRRITKKEAAAFRQALDPAIRTVGVFVNERPEVIERLCEEGILNAVQLHGSEDEGDIRRIRQITSLPVIKAVRVRSREDVRAAVGLSADYLLFDTYTERDYGGSGTCFDWSMLSGTGRPFFLAGGLNPQNIRQAAESTRPYAVDVSSGVETDGYKDAGKIEAFIRAVREGEAFGTEGGNQNE